MPACSNIVPSMPHLAVASKVDAWLDRGGAYPFSDTATSSPSEDDMRRTQGFATLVCALLEKDVDSTDLVAVRVAVAWALAWGVLGRALACGETDDVQEPIHKDCSAWLHEHVNAGDDKRIEEALFRAGAAAGPPDVRAVVGSRRPQEGGGRGEAAQIHRSSLIIRGRADAASRTGRVCGKVFSARHARRRLLRRRFEWHWKDHHNGGALF